MNLFKKKYFILLLFSSSILAQVSTKEIGLITDNDSYTSTKSDKYYTNGLTFFYRYLGKINDSTIVKKTNEILLGQYIYTPSYLNLGITDKNDHPFAGYLFTGFEKSLFYTNQNVLKIGFQIGFIGPNAYAQEVQNEIHQTLKINKFKGWENQIHNELALQSHFMFSKKLFPKTKQKIIDFNWHSDADIGTVFTQINTGIVTRIGFKKLLNISDSNLYGAAVGTSKEKNNEFYFFLAPSIRYQIYDGTIQGSLFNDESPNTFPIVPVRFNTKAGLVYRKNNFNLSYSFVYTSKEIADSTSVSFFYGSIGLSILLK